MYRSWCYGHLYGRAAPAQCEYRNCPPIGGWRNYGDTHRHTTHPSSITRIGYRPHPFCRQTVEIIRWLRRQPSDSLVVQLPDGIRIAVPSWMLDPLACSQVNHAPAPYVSVDALLVLRALLNHQPPLLTSEPPPTSCVSQPKGVRHAQEASPLPIALLPSPLCPYAHLATAASAPMSSVSRAHHPIAHQCHARRAPRGEQA